MRAGNMIRLKSTRGINYVASDVEAHGDQCEKHTLSGRSITQTRDNWEHFS